MGIATTSTPMCSRDETLVNEHAASIHAAAAMIWFEQVRRRRLGSATAPRLATERGLTYVEGDVT